MAPLRTISFLVQCLCMCVGTDWKYNWNLRKDKDLAKEALIEGGGVLCSRTVDRGIRTYLKVVHS